MGYLTILFEQPGTFKGPNTPSDIKDIGEGQTTWTNFVHHNSKVLPLKFHGKPLNSTQIHEIPPSRTMESQVKS